MADDEVKAVTGRPNDTPVRDPEPAPLGGNTTFADRAKARGVKAKAVEKSAVEDKSLSGSRARRK